VSAGSEELTGELRRLLADLTGHQLALTAPLDTALLRDGIGLDSLGGTMLLTEIERRYGVDIAAEDLNLDALASIGTLAAYLARRADPAGCAPAPAPDSEGGPS
jgi:acyl carrier protein